MTMFIIKRLQCYTFSFDEAAVSKKRAWEADAEDLSDDE